MGQARQLAIALSLALLAPSLWAQSDVTIPAVFEEVTERARDLATKDYADNPPTLPEALREIDYDVYRTIRFRGENALWRDESLFSVQLFHPGFLYDRPVTINLVEDGEIRHLPFQKRFFSYDGDAASLAEHDLSGAGFAGFRVHYPLNRTDHHDEFLVFLGATYFRIVGRGQRYGLSARGLAIDTASPRGEEFPAFREFWLFQPEPDATTMHVVALLDSPSLSGAYHFTVTPGERVSMEVEARLFAREDVNKLGIAPLTSMFFHGSPSPRPADDFRPRAHDSDGLLMHTSAGEWIWRPLTNPRELRITRLRDESPAGFGLTQRKRDFDSYLDTALHYERRPSQWVEPLSEWGPGSVELVEIPTDSETNDNIVAYWVPEQPMTAGEERTYRYRTSTFDASLPQQSLASVVRARQGRATAPDQNEPPPRGHRQFVVDFRGGELSTLDDSHPVEAQLSASTGKVEQLRVERLPDGKTWRASFRLLPDGKTPMDLRLLLTLRGQPMTETWNYVWNPDELR
ncbi:glucan biosynthesis protein D [Litchfieldella qijiaojingensis]|uniref:Glucans biosynthesis protein G n=1 Tax=Litchfieldella qijiaojingensis TaxID=980347 RepID=A0ABQ2YR71_9GAMM|nr:glucan biosynthesis protein [Halomonas qijiaojingensis]GGX92097.1 glucan biosynthesis protein D [Halomonas qijiaojingensis]